MKAKKQSIVNVNAGLSSRARRHNARVSAESDIAELFLAELQARRERLKELMKLISLEVARTQKRSTRLCGPRVPGDPAARAYRTGRYAQQEL